MAGRRRGGAKGYFSSSCVTALRASICDVRSIVMRAARVMRDEVAASASWAGVLVARPAVELVRRTLEFVPLFANAYCS